MLVTVAVALAVVAVLAAIVVVAVGRGGELSAGHPDHPPLGLPSRPVGGTDAALLRLPMGVWGYHKQITDEALQRFAHELTDRDTRIAVLERQLAEARERLGDDAPPFADRAGLPAAPAAVTVTEPRPDPRSEPRPELPPLPDPSATTVHDDDDRLAEAARAVISRDDATPAGSPSPSASASASASEEDDTAPAGSLPRDDDAASADAPSLDDHTAPAEPSRHDDDVAPVGPPGPTADVDPDPESEPEDDRPAGNGALDEDHVFDERRIVDDADQPERAETVAERSDRAGS